MSSKDNTYTNTRTFFLSDDVDNESVGKLIWEMLYQINDDNKRMKKKRIINAIQLNCTSIPVVELFMICGR